MAIENVQSDLNPTPRSPLVNLRRGCELQFIAFAVVGVISGAALAYIDAYHVLEIDEGFKFKTPAAVWRFQFNIWWPLVLLMAAIFGCTTYVMQRFARTSTVSNRTLRSASAAVLLTVMLYLIPKFDKSGTGFLVGLLIGPIVSGIVIEYFRKSRRQQLD